jgi:hypothetical protein
MATQVPGTPRESDPAISAPDLEPDPDPISTVDRRLVEPSIER